MPRVVSGYRAVVRLHKTRRDTYTAGIAPYNSTILLSDVPVILQGLRLSVLSAILRCHAENQYPPPNE